jgi:hypothetical protein
MIRRLSYAGLTAALVTLIALFAVRALRGERHSLPSIDTVPEALAGLSCENGLAAARQLTTGGALEHARLAYLWLIEHCEEPVLPEALLEGGSLFGHLLGRPAEAEAAYAMFLERFPGRDGAADATYHLAKLEIDAGEYASAAAHLTALADRYPGGRHEQSARFLAAEALEMLEADRRAQRTVAGQLGALVPNNPWSVLALLLAIAPSAISTLRQARRDWAGGTVRWPWLVPAVIIGLTLFNSILNNVDNARRNTLAMEKLDRLLEARAQVPNDG